MMAIDGESDHSAIEPYFNETSEIRIGEAMHR